MLIKCLKGMRDRLGKLFGKRQSGGYDQMDEKMCSFKADTLHWKDQSMELYNERKVTEVLGKYYKKNILEAWKLEDWKLEPHVPDPEIDSLVEQMIDLYFKFPQIDMDCLSSVVNTFGHDFDRFYDSLRRETKLWNLRNTSVERKHCIMHVGGVEPADQNKFTKDLQTIDPERKMACFNIFAKIHYGLEARKNTKKYRKCAKVVQVLEQAAKVYDMKQALEHAKDGGIAIVHTSLFTGEEPHLKEWYKLLKNCAKDSAVPLIRSDYRTDKLGRAREYDYLMAKYVRWYSTHVLDFEPDVIDEKYGGSIMCY